MHEVCAVRLVRCSVVVSAGRMDLLCLSWLSVRRVDRIGESLAWRDGRGGRGVLKSQPARSNIVVAPTRHSFTRHFNKFPQLVPGQRDFEFSVRVRPCSADRLALRCDCRYPYHNTKQQLLSKGHRIPSSSFVSHHRCTFHSCHILANHEPHRETVATQIPNNAPSVPKISCY